MALLNSSGAIAQFQRNRCSISPVEPISRCGVRTVRRKLRRGKVAIIRAECGSGKTKIGSTALGALYARRKTFNVVMCPSHITKKWVREIGETLPDTYGMVIKSPAEFDRLYGMYASGDKSVYAIMSKEKARDGYMRYPAVIWSDRQKGFLCPDCREPVQMEISDDGTKYLVNADQFFFLNENKKNHKCLNCGSVLWAPVSNTRKLPWIKISKYGWVYTRCDSEYAKAVNSMSVIPLTGTPKGEYWYRNRQLMECLRVTEGMTTIGVAQNGLLTVSTESSYYFQSPVRAPTTVRKAPDPAPKAA